MRCGREDKERFMDCWVETVLFICLNCDIKTGDGNFYIDTDGIRREVTAEDIGYMLSLLRQRK